MSHYLRKRQRSQRKFKQTRQQLARSHRPLNQQLVEKILDRHGRQ